MNEPRFASISEGFPAVIQDHATNEVLMVGYLDHKAWELTLADGRVHYLSRKKRRMWLKGEQSGHYQFVREILLNCDETCLLLKVEQIGGACDQGFKSCFDKVLKDDGFRIVGTRIFDPEIAYPGSFHANIRFGIPSGALETMTLRLLDAAGYDTWTITESLRASEQGATDSVEISVVTSKDIPVAVVNHRLDAAIVGFDVVEEAGVSLRDVCDLGYNKLGLGHVPLTLALPIGSVDTLANMERIHVATAYPNLVKKWFSKKGMTLKVHIDDVESPGKLPTGADAIVELVESGRTLSKNNLRPVSKVFETSAHLVASNEAWGYTWKRRRIEEIADRLTAATSRLPNNPKTILDITT